MQCIHKRILEGLNGTAMVTVPALLRGKSTKFSMRSVKSLRVTNGGNLISAIRPNC